VSVVVGSGYTLHYFDEQTGEHVSVPLESLDHLSVQVHKTGSVVTYDELGTFTMEDVERLADLPEVKDHRTVALLDVDYSTMERRLLAHALENPGVIEASFDVLGFDERAVRRIFAKPDLDSLSPYTQLERRRPDWQDRGPQHKNRKKRSWRR